MIAKIPNVITFTPGLSPSRPPPPPPPHSLILAPHLLWPFPFTPSLSLTPHASLPYSIPHTSLPNSPPYVHPPAPPSPFSLISAWFTWLIRHLAEHTHRPFNSPGKSASTYCSLRIHCQPPTFNSFRFSFWPSSSHPPIFVCLALNLNSLFLSLILPLPFLLHSLYFLHFPPLPRVLHTLFVYFFSLLLYIRFSCTLSSSCASLSYPFLPFS